MGKDNKFMINGYCFDEIEFKDIPILSEGEIFRETILRKAEELEQMVYMPRNIDIPKLFSDRPQF